MTKERSGHIPSTVYEYNTGQNAEYSRSEHCRLIAWTSRKRKFLGANTLLNESFREQRFLGQFAREVNVSGSESSRERIGKGRTGAFALGTNWPGSEMAWYYWTPYVLSSRIPVGHPRHLVGHDLDNYFFYLVCYFICLFFMHVVCCTGHMSICFQVSLTSWWHSVVHCYFPCCR